MKGLFLTFEGVDGCGKSTQMRMLGEYLRERGVDCLTTREPGGCPVSEQIREILLNVENGDMNDETEALLYAAARAEHIDHVILPALRAGKVVLCDRYLDSSIAYQGYARGLGVEAVLAFNRYALERCMPDVTFFFDFTPEEARVRKRKRTSADRLERMDDRFFDRVYEGFVCAAERDPRRILRLEVEGTKYETQQKIRAIVDGLLA